MMEHTIHSLALTFVSEQINYHANHGVWEDVWDALLLFLQRTVDENTARRLVEEANDPTAEDTFEEDQVYDKLTHIVSCEDEINEEAYQDL